MKRSLKIIIVYNYSVAILRDINWSSFNIRLNWLYKKIIYLIIKYIYDYIDIKYAGIVA